MVTLAAAQSQTRRLRGLAARLARYRADHMAVSPDGRSVAVSASTSDTVHVLDIVTDLSDAVRPAVFTPDESKLYFQVSFFAGLVEYDVASDRVTRVRELPKNPLTSVDPTTWSNDSRHHGLSVSPDGARLRVAATEDDDATVVDRASLTPGELVPASKPYWATVSGDGRSCVISESGADRVSAIDFASGRTVASVAVGDHPQRVRIGHVPAGWTAPRRP